MIPWEIEATELSSCNCNYGCPCQFNSPPTHGHCEAMVGIVIHRGHFGEASLDGLKVAFVMQWPGPIHEGGGKAYIVVDENADEPQRQGLLAILSGEETEPGATIFNVFAATLDTVFDPDFKAIDIEIDVEARVGHVRVDGVGESVGRPILNPVTGEPHRARINLPEGFEYTVAEMGSSTWSTSGPIALSHTDSYAQFAHLHMNNQGVVRGKAA